MNILADAFDTMASLRLTQAGWQRRIKNVTLTIPCVVGPYTGVHCRLTLLGSATRVDDDGSARFDIREQGCSICLAFAARYHRTSWR